MNKKKPNTHKLNSPIWTLTKQIVQVIRKIIITLWTCTLFVFFFLFIIKIVSNSMTKSEHLRQSWDRSFFYPENRKKYTLTQNEYDFNCRLFRNKYGINIINDRCHLSLFNMVIVGNQSGINRPEHYNHLNFTVHRMPVQREECTHFFAVVDKMVREPCTIEDKHIHICFIIYMSLFA